ncbi:alpha/beta fold hydrolase [Pontiella sulfatireligans]|uniref:Cephalosporin-C deacetylase n=1 Tax=Pontiella sulfatireligans TaxID=2750658 RepID=A0A6C2URL6_9BACT|nr:alpha/beta fold hydrolase [Pontiella sulfatireligans]VGO22898.1 Cephalosporin-C deacetylase [Pontiella sulfatireligans]
MPSTFDMPLEKLLLYQGTNPNPGDFDAYWEKAAAEMLSVDPQIEIIPDEEFQTSYAVCSHLWFTGIGGARIHAKLIHPKLVEEKRPAVLMFHGYTGDCGGWLDKLAYVAAGYAVAALDCRGQGGLSEDVGGVSGNTHYGHIIRGLEDGAEKLLYRSNFLDTVQLAHIVMGLDRVDEARIGTIGGSQGGALALVCAALEPRIQRVAALHPFLCDYQRVWEMDLAKDAYAELTDFFRRVDPQHKRQDEFFTRLGYIDVQHHVSKISADVFFGATLADTICPPSTQFAAYNKITAEKSIEIYPDFGHEPPPGFAEQTFQFMMEL